MTAPVDQPRYASLAMYPFEWLRPAWEQLWSVVHQYAPWTPASLRWDGDVHDHWVDPCCRVAHACGWPVVTALRTRVDVVGSFAPALADADDHRYRSVILAAQPNTFADLVATDARVAANGPDSLSGWISLRAAARGLDDAWPRRVRWTGDHVESVRVLQAGRADVISIDELTLAHLRDHAAELLVGLVEVGRGPLVPSLPVIVPADTPARHVEDLRGALTAAVADSALAAAHAQLLLDHFVPLDATAFDALLTLDAPR